MAIEYGVRVSFAYYICSVFLRWILFACLRYMFYGPSWKCFQWEVWALFSRVKLDAAERQPIEFLTQCDAVDVLVKVFPVLT